MANTLLQERRGGQNEGTTLKGYIETTHVNKGLERQIVSHLIIDSVRSDWVVRNIFHVCISKVECSIKNRGGDAVDTRVLFSLDFMQLVHELLVELVHLAIVVENIFNELIESVRRDDRRLRFAQG